ncbi:hypothetical protein vseg_001871 [Gypsophila vaccaria]
MYSTYSSYSSTVALRTTYFEFNDNYCSCCCDFSVNSSRLMLPMNLNPSLLLYGLRQSTLIQCSPSRRVVSGSCVRFCSLSSSSSIYDLGCCRCCCCCYAEKGFVGMRKCVGVDGGIRGERDFRCNALEGRKREGVGNIRGRVIRDECDFQCDALEGRKSGGVDGILGRSFRVERRKSGGVGVIRERVIRGERDFRSNEFIERKSGGVEKVRGRVVRGERDFRCNALDDAEAMLSLLVEEGVDECVVTRDRRKSSSKDPRVVTKQNVVSETWKDGRGNSYSGSGYLERKSKKQELKSSRDRFREETESNLIEEDKGLRRRESGSSYYSVLESGEFESDSEVDFELERVVGVSSTRQEKDSRKTGGVVINEVTNDVVESSKEEKDRQLISSQCENERVGSSTEWDWRKKSEKKLTDESAEVTESRKESILRQTKSSQGNEHSFIVGSSSKKQFSNIEEESMSEFRSHRQSSSRTQRDDSVSEYTKSSGWNEQSFTGNHVSEHLVSGSQHEQSTSGASSSGKLKSQVKIDNQSSEYLKSYQQHEQSSRINRQNIDSTSTTTRTPILRKGAVVVGQSVQKTGCDYCETCGRIVQESEINSGIEQHAELSQVHGDARWNTTFQGHSDSRHKIQEMDTSLSQTLVEKESKKWDSLNSAAEQVDGRISGQYSESLDFDYSYDQSTLRIQKQQEKRKKKLEDTSTSVISPSDGKKLPVGLSDQVTKETDSHKLLQIGALDSQVHSTTGEISRHSADTRIINEQTYSTLEFVEKHKTRLITEVHETVSQVGLTGNFSGEVNTSQLTVGSTSQTGAQQVNKVEGQHLVTSPAFQLIERKSSDSEPESSIFRTSTGSEVDSSSGYSQPQATRLSSVDEPFPSGIRFVEESSLEDAISTVERMHESSSQIVQEFVDKTRHDSSVPATRIEKESSQADNIDMVTGSPDSLRGEATFLKQDSGQVSEVSGTKGRLDNMWDAKDHSTGDVSESEFREAEISKDAVARRTGRSLWNVVGGLFRLRWGSVSETQKSPDKLSQQRSSDDSATGETWFSGNEHDEGTGDGMKNEQIILSQEPTSANQSPIMFTASTSRLGDRRKKQLIIMPQGPTSELPSSKEKATKSRKKDRRKKEQRSTSEEPALDLPLHHRTTNKSQKGEAKLVSLDDRLGPVELHVSSSAGASQGGLVSGSVSIGANTSIGANSGLTIVQQTSHPSPPSPLVPSFGRLRRSDALKESEEFEKIEEHITSTGEQGESVRQNVLVPSARQPTRSDASEGTKEAGKNKELTSSTSELKGRSVDVMESRILTSEEMDTELKRRKLQRSKQVLSDRFDEWEDAYRLENEQRKVDEIFMREALAEAIKAADSWEVPVGAVLVQNGKVIARGYNLVEELRDSTAHAEMICIREASNVLKTWRLSETTLYVTLEPCPMCAGAILQARIGTLVWGAPNKLLGADGSWIRLFPGGVEGERPEITDKPTPPVHPFHPKMKVRRGVLEPECAQVMQQFFQLRRKKEKGKEKETKSDGEGQPSCLPVPHNPAKLLRKMHGVFHIM